MGLSFTLTGFPLMVLILSILFQGGQVSGTAPVCANTAGAVGCKPSVPIGTAFTVDQCGLIGIFVNNPPQNSQYTRCLSNTGLDTVTQTLVVWPGPGTGLDCSAGAACQPTIYPIASNQNILTLGFTIGAPITTKSCTTTVNTLSVITDFSCTSNANYYQTGLAASNGNFALIANVGNTWTIILIIALGIVALAGITVISSSVTSTESLHILFVIGLMMAIWGILSLVEGFVNVTGSPSPTSIFTGLDNFYNGIGTTLYLLLTLIYVISGVAAVSRGGN